MECACSNSIRTDPLFLFSHKNTHTHTHTHTHTLSLFSFLLVSFPLSLQLQLESSSSSPVATGICSRVQASPPATETLPVFYILDEIHPFNFVLLDEIKLSNTVILDEAQPTYEFIQPSHIIVWMKYNLQMSSSNPQILYFGD